MKSALHRFWRMEADWTIVRIKTPWRFIVETPWGHRMRVDYGSAVCLRTWRPW